MNTLTITIGRNVPAALGGPAFTLDLRRWHRFQWEAVDAVREAAIIADVSTIHYGIGEWKGESEESAILTWFEANLDAGDLRRIEDAMTDLARRYGQDSIAIMYAPVVFA